MPPLPPPADPTPRLIVYHQTHHRNGDEVIPLTPLLNTPLTHLILAAIHLNRDDVNPHITLNDHHPNHPGNDSLRHELKMVQAGGIKVLGMLGGAARGSFKVLDYDFSAQDMGGAGGEERFKTYYKLLHGFVQEWGLDGLDLDVEEEFSLSGCTRLIDRLKADFGKEFIITLAPVASALWSRDPKANMSGFDYLSLEKMRGGSINWYNAQFYNGWSSASEPQHYFSCMAQGFEPEKIVMGVLTNQKNGGSGYVEVGELVETILTVSELVMGMDKKFGGVMGWEFFNAVGFEQSSGPEEWVQMLGAVMGVERPEPSFGEADAKEHDGQNQKVVMGKVKTVDGAQEADEAPKPFEYDSDTNRG